jgi:hypothetical protein
MRATFFAIFTVLMFFNPNFGNHEVFPYWLILTPFFLNKINFALYSIFFVTLLLIIFNIFIYDNIGLYVTDSLQVLSVILAYFFFKDLNNNEVVKFLKIIEIFIWIQCIVMILQNFFPNIQSISAELFAGRPSSLVTVALTRNNAVTGFSPEPSYGSSLLVGLYFMILLHNRSKIILILPVLLSLFLFKSVYGFGIFYIFFILYMLKIRKYFLWTIFINIILLLIALFNITSNSSVERFILFVNELASSKSLLLAEKFVSGDSTRLDFLVIFKNWSEFNIYYKSISFGVYYIQSSHFLILLFLPLTILISKKNNLLSNVVVIFLLFLITPILIWPSFFVLVYFLNLKSIKVNENYFN